MQVTKEKISNMASSAKEHVEIYQAKVEEKAEKAAASTKEEKKIAEEKRKAKVAEAKKELHEAKARHAAEKLSHKQAHLRHGHHAHGATTTTAAAAMPYTEPAVGTHLHHGHPTAAAAVPYGQTEPAVRTHLHHGHGHHTTPPIDGTTTKPLVATHGHERNRPVGTVNPMAGATAPTFPLGPQYPPTRYM